MTGRAGMTGGGRYDGACGNDGGEATMTGRDTARTGGEATMTGRDAASTEEGTGRTPLKCRDRLRNKLFFCSLALHSSNTFTRAGEVE